MHNIDSCLETLAAQAHPAGGWGYRPGQEAHLEPTCLALLALSLEPSRFQSAIDQGKQALRLHSTRNGSYVLSRGRQEAIWPTALVLFVQASLGYATEEVRRTAERLLVLSGRVPDDPRSAEMHDIDFGLRGWAWAENNFSWAEPTAWACLALRRAGLGAHPRVAEGLRLLLDRAQDRGGINYGNRSIFGRATEPIPGPTALMLLALQDPGPSEGGVHPRITTALTYLAQHAATSDDLEHLCWAKLALEAHRETTGLAALDERIRAAHDARATTPWLQPAPLREALTSLALASDRHALFRLTPPSPALAVSPSATSTTPIARGGLTRLKSYFRGLALDVAGNLRPLPLRSPVHIAAVRDYHDDLAGILQQQFEAFRAQVPLAGKRVVLKPNLVEYHRDKVINTHPNVVAAVIELCRRENAAEIIVAEGPGHWRNVEHLVRASGLGDVLRHYRVPFVDLNHDEPVQTLNLGRLTSLEYLYLAQTVLSADVLISLPKLKTHHWAGATLSLKNLFGTLPGICYGWPKNELHWRGIPNSIVDIALTRTPQLAIVDGIVGMEGDGPLNGTPKTLGALIMGTDLVAVDATCCRLMQLDPERVDYLMLGQRKKLGVLGEKAIQQIGDKIETLAQPFETLPQFQSLRLARAAN